jgi:hypothetical protein
MIKKSSRNKILSLIIFIGLMSLIYATQAEQPITINPGNGTIQEAIDNASTGDTILLENGTYTGSGNYNIIVNKSVTIKAAPNANPIINAEGQGRIFDITADNVILNGLTITGGNNTYGGAIENYGANLNVGGNTIFINNTADYGGAIGNYGDSLNVGGNTIFINNTSNNYYGGSAIDNNGGANFRVSNTSFINNADTFGSAIYNYGGGDNFSVIGCVIVGNSGGISNTGANAIINYNMIVNNTDYGLHNTGGINADYNWWGTNNIANAGITGVVPNSYFVIQLSANGNYTRNNTTMSGLVAPVSLTYNGS